MKNSLFGVIRSGVLASLIAGALVSTGQSQTLIYTNIWSIAPNTRDYVTSGTTERGIAISPVDNTVYIVSRAAAVGGLGIFVLNGESGEEIKTEFDTPLKLSTTGITGGGLVLNSIGVADDGVIYACNVATTANTFKIYRWENTNSEPTVAYGPAQPGPGTRYGDTMDVRGAGANTQIIVSGSGNAGFAVLTTADGVNFTSTGYAMPAGTAAGDVGKGPERTQR